MNMAHVDKICILIQYGTKTDFLADLYNKYLSITGRSVC